jgi:hypothetical protein
LAAVLKVCGWIDKKMTQFDVQGFPLMRARYSNRVRQLSHMFACLWAAVELPNLGKDHTTPYYILYP